MSPEHGKHGVIRNSLFKSHTSGWTRVWAWILYDDGSEGSEMKRYLCREDEVQRLICPKCKGENGYKSGAGFEGNLYEIHFTCTDCKYDWWIPEYLLKRMAIPDDL